MRIGVFSDSHGKKDLLLQSVRALAPLDGCIHLGDYCADADVLEELNVPLWRVRGNGDRFRQDVPERHVLRIGGVTMLLLHGHQVMLQNDIRLAGEAQREDASVLLYGHTHRSRVQHVAGVLLVNPGSLSRPRDGKRSVALLTIRDGRAIPSVITVK